MKDFLKFEDVIYKNFARVITEKFVKLRYGIASCLKKSCNKGDEIRYELLNWQLKKDCYELTSEVKARENRVIRLPKSSVLLVADFTGECAAETILWTTESGPTSPAFSAEDSLVTYVSNLVEGTYVFKVTVTDTNADEYSDLVVIKVNAACGVVTGPQIFWGYFAEDPFATIEVSGTTALQFNREQVDPTGIYSELEFSSSAIDTYVVLKEPTANTTKTTWYNSVLNSGTIPDQVFRTPFVVGDFRYYVSREPIQLPSNNTKITFE